MNAYSHDGLGLKTPQPESEPEPVPEPMVTFPDWQDISQAGGIFDDSEAEPVVDDESMLTGDLLDDCSSLLGNDGGISGGGINPATGLPMADSMIDVGGNVYGMSDDSMSIGTGMDSGFGIDTFGSPDDGFL
ncbi:hypothetical protein [Marinobacter sp. S6332]|uniref:hypothetical protein n=1 Tax=Marinobacter sp. S6332 TaxID=2926403 RepID=UPI001FF1023E|nr:hypothetical protein [Marinobacter sp. S6332]MCK0164860.1 hypothetical protein [Marinobacter sp. S6332]